MDQPSVHCHEHLFRVLRACPGTTYPDAKQCQQQIKIDRLGDVIGSTGVQTFLPIALHRFGSNGNERDVSDRRRPANAPHRLVAVHLRHHDIDQSCVNIGNLFQQRDTVSAAFRMQHLYIVGLQDTGERVDVADIVVDDENLRPRQIGLAGLFGSWSVVVFPSFSRQCCRDM